MPWLWENEQTIQIITCHYVQLQSQRIGTRQAGSSWLLRASGYGRSSRTAVAGATGASITNIDKVVISNSTNFRRNWSSQARVAICGIKKTMVKSRVQQTSKMPTFIDLDLHNLSSNKFFNRPSSLGMVPVKALLSVESKRWKTTVNSRVQQTRQHKRQPKKAFHRFRHTQIEFFQVCQLA
jgi:hypothetical protein